MALNIFKSRKQASAGGRCLNVADTPNGWGHQEFDGTYLHFDRDKQRDVNNKLERFSFIRAFQIRHIDGIRLKKPQAQKICQHCNC